MATIWKFQAPTPVSTEVHAVPLGAKFIRVDWQTTTSLMPQMWAIVDPEAPRVERLFRIIGTGHTFDQQQEEYIGSYSEPPFEWHVVSEKEY